MATWATWDTEVKYGTGWEQEEEILELENYVLRKFLKQLLEETKESGVLEAVFLRNNWTTEESKIIKSLL